jgi:putative oxidoreductase
MNSSRPRCEILGNVAAWLVAAAFAVAGALKLADPAGFATDIGHYRLVPPLVAAALAVYLPWMELALAVGLCVPRLRPAARLLGLELIAVFCAALTAALARGLDIRCGCFGGGEAGGVTAGWALARNAVLIALLAVARSPSRRASGS